jgi:hypothetical protein
MLPHEVIIPSNIRVRRAVGLHELYKSVMIVGFLLEVEASSRARHTERASGTLRKSSTNRARAIPIA